MDLVQKWSFLQLVFLGNIGHENVFYDIEEEEVQKVEKLTIFQRD